MSRQKYEDFLKTDYWKEVSRKVKERGGFRCQVCNSQHDLQAHHRTYDHRGSELKHLDDLICMCRRCHGIFHGTIQIQPIEVEKVEEVRYKKKIKYKRCKDKPVIDVSTEMPEGEGPFVLTYELIQKTRANGSFTNATMRAYGLKTPLHAGWVERLIGTTISKAVYKEALEGKYWYGSGRL